MRFQLVPKSVTLNDIQWRYGPVVSSSFFFFLLFTSHNLSRHRLDAYHISTCTWCGLSANLLQRRPSPEANQILDDVWSCPGLVHYLYTFGGSCPLTEFCQVQNSLCVPSLAFSYIGSLTARHSNRGRQPNFVAWYKECNYETFADALPIFGSAAITLGIGPHSSFALFHRTL